jgi:hypothetical protein
VLGVNIFRSVATAAKPATVSGTEHQAEQLPIFELKLKKDGIVARAQEVDGEFTVLPGSTARMQWVGVEGHSYRGLREKLEHDGTLLPSPDGKTMHFARGQVFSSPSAAAAVVLGRSANGKNEWIAQGSRLTYGEWQTQGVEDAVRGAAV